MKLYPYWSRAERTITDAEDNRLRLRKWGGSDISAEDAARIAEGKLETLARRLMQKADLFAAADYTYSSRDLPEELIEQIDNSSGITRNRYGCLVLNSNSMMIADIDLPQPGFFTTLRRLLGSKRLTSETEAMQRLAQWLQRNPEASVRIYRTAAGLRYLFTHQPMAADKKALAILDALGSDRLYVFLCREQECFRARLSPKPWRCAQERPPQDYFPFQSAESETRFRAWLANYDKKAGLFATCQFVGEQGSKRCDPALEAQLKRHDELTKAFVKLPLA